MKRWIRVNPLAQLMGFLMREFHLKFEDFEDMTAQQFCFLIAWSEWFNEQLGRRAKRR